MKPALVDVNVYLGQWPFRRVPGDEPPVLVERLRSGGVERAWAGHFDGVFHRDLAAVNQRLAQLCRATGDGLLIPVGSINPALPDWEDDVKRCVEQHGMQVIRLHPNYHGYKLDDRSFATLLDAACERKLIVQISASLEDERTQSALARAPVVNLAPLEAHVNQRAAARVVLLNAWRGATIEWITRLVQTRRVWVDIANLETVGGVERLWPKVTPDRVLFGSHFPLFYWEAAQLKLRESELTDEQLRLVGQANALALLDDTKSQ